MRIALKASLGALLTLLLVASLLDGSAGARDNGRLAQARQALAAVEALSAPARPPRPGEALPRRDVSLLMRDLVHAQSALPAAERARAEKLTSGGLTTGQAVPPYPGCETTNITHSQTSAHFEVYYNLSKSAQATKTIAVLEEVWNYEVGILGYRSPPPYDADGRVDIFLCDTYTLGAYGYCTPDTVASHSSSFCVLDDDFAQAQFGGDPDESLKVTAAHEFFHAIQFGYDSYEDSWFMEGTAVWMESQVYPAITDYLQYLKRSSLTQPQIPVDYAGNLDRYGSVLFWKFLSERYRDYGLIKRIWEYADSANGSRYSIQAVAAALAARRSSLTSAFAWYGAWNTKPRGSYAAGAAYPTQAWWRTATLTKRKRKLRTQAVALRHLTSAPVLLTPAKLPKKAKLRITVDGPNRERSPAATVQVRKRNGSVTISEVSLSKRGDGTMQVPFDPRKIASVVVVLSNASARFSPCRAGTAYSCGGVALDDGQRYAVSAQVKLKKKRR